MDEKRLVKNLSPEQLEAKRAREREYGRRYRQSEKGLATRARAQNRYTSTEKGQKTRGAYLSETRGTLEHLLTKVLAGSRVLARKRGHDLTIDKAHIEHLYYAQGGRCYWTGLEIMPSCTANDPYKPSLDRLDNSIGYVPGNVVWSAWAINRLRGDLSVDAFRDLLATLGHALNVCR